MKKLALILLLGYTLSGCVEEANTPIIDNSYDATTATKPYKNQGKSLEDCHLVQPHETAENRGCLDYESIEKTDNQQRKK